MDRTEKVGLAVAGAGHLALLAVLALGFAAAPNPAKLAPHAIEVSLAPDVAIQQSAPPAPEPPSASVAPDQGAPEDAAPPAPAEAPPTPEPKPAPPPEPKPALKPSPVAKPAEKPAPAPKPVPTARPKPPQAAADKSAPKPAPAPAKPAPAKAAPAKSSSAAKPATAKPTAAPAKGNGATETAKAVRPRGSRLGADFLKGLSADAPATAKASTAAPGATMSAKATADIGSAIRRQVQPCANRQVTPGPGAERIRVAITLKLNRDGSLATPPRIVSHDGVDDDNRRYLDRVDDIAIATFAGCAPLTGLPPELYDVQNGWRSFTLRYKLPG